MKPRLIALLPLVLCLLAASAEASADTRSIDARVAELLDAMTVEQKVGQMTQVTLGILIDKDIKDDAVIVPEKLHEALHTYQVGSILNTASRPLSVAQWNDVIKTIQDKALETGHAIPVLYGIDSIHGANYVKGSTLFPHNIGMAATRNSGLAQQAARVTAMETRAAGIRWNFDPVFDLGVNPLWSRFPETFGEDSYLVQTLGIANVRGYNEDGLDAPTSVASCMKHYLGYSDPANGKDRTPAYIPDVVLWEKHLPPFAAAVKAGSPTIMINSASINGVPVHGSKRLLTDVLRGELGFEGLVVSDWQDVIRLHTRHRVAETPREAVRQAVEAGLDMSMVPHDYSFAEHLVDLVKSGEVSEERIDRSVAIILRLKMELGLFDNPYQEPAAVQNFGKPEYSDLALQAALESMTLLENRNDVLPLSKDAKVLLAGPAAMNLGPLHGSWSYTWQGDNENVYPESTKTLRDVFVERLGAAQVLTVAQKGFHADGNYDVEKLNSLASEADVIILALGERAYAESPGWTDDLNLAAEQKALAKAAAETGKPVVLVLVEGRPRIINDIVPLVDGILLAYQPGSRGADAIADVVFGDYNPAGVLPYSYPQFTGDIMPYDHGVLAEIQQLKPAVITYGGYKPQWPFGHGLSYTTFEYSDLKLDRKVLGKGESLKVSVTVNNTGGRGGHHAVDLFVSDLYASISPAARKLRRYGKAYIEAGGAQTIEFELQTDDLSFVNLDLKRVVEPGEFRVSVGDLSDTFTFK
ncbi:MAG: glycoside hydrolase family 3 N-terminal domain-containing protein [Lysobacterales bacterium]|jgi:beta-glucosidase